VPEPAAIGVAVEGSTNVWPGSPARPALPTFGKFTQPSRDIEVFNRGKTPFKFSATARAPWILVSQTRGTIEKGVRLWVSVNWKTAPVGSTNGVIEISDGETNAVAIVVRLFNPASPARDSVDGFVEATGVVAIEAEHFTRQVATPAARWEKIADLGDTLSGMEVFPVTAASVTPPENSPCLEYKMHTFNAGQEPVEFVLSPTLNFVAGRGLRFAAAFDDAAPQIITAVPADFSVGEGNDNRDWQHTVSDGVRRVKTTLHVNEPGVHTLKVWMVDPGVVLQKIVINFGGLKPSYFGPQESFHR
jgi:hypothetical protein